MVLKFAEALVITAAKIRNQPPGNTPFVLIFMSRCRLAT
jgi:hypothetical protein